MESHLDSDLELYSDRPLCKPCDMFYSALVVVFTLDPTLRFSYVRNYNEKGRRVLNFTSHSIPSEQKVGWIKMHLEAYSAILPPGRGYGGPCSPCEEEPDIARWIDTWELAEVLCHIVRYSMLIPHSDSVRYRPSSHVVPARCNPFRFVKSAR